MPRGRPKVEEPETAKSAEESRIKFEQNKAKSNRDKELARRDASKKAQKEAEKGSSSPLVRSA